MTNNFEKRQSMSKKKKSEKKSKPTHDPDTEPDWTGKCSVCGASPVVPATCMCGPCTWGEAETADGNW